MLNTAFSFANLMTIKKWTVTFFNVFKVGMPSSPINGRGMRAKEVSISLVQLFMGRCDFIPVRPTCRHGNLEQFLRSCSMATWRTWSSEAKESFS